jgi:hypothetical protein
LPVTVAVLRLAAVPHRWFGEEFKKERHCPRGTQAARRVSSCMLIDGAEAVFALVYNPLLLLVSFESLSTSPPTLSSVFASTLVSSEPATYRRGAKRSAAARLVGHGGGDCCVFTFDFNR